MFAFRAELDGWANQCRPPVDDPTNVETSVVPASPARSTGTWWTVTALLLTAVTGAVAWTAEHRVHGSATPIERVPVLVADFGNHTGDQSLDDSLHFVFERELAASDILTIVARPRVQDVLLLMRRAPDTRLMPNIAREVALRDGNVRALVTARVDADGARYLLTVDVIDVRSGAPLATRNTEVGARPQLLTAVRQLAGWARHMLDETARTALSDSRPPQVTTSSLSALNLYAQAMEAIDHDRQQVARTLLDSALREDQIAQIAGFARLLDTRYMAGTQQATRRARRQRPPKRPPRAHS